MFDDNFVVYIEVLMKRYGGKAATITAEDGTIMAGIIWENSRWDNKNRLVPIKGKNEPKKTIETE